MALVLAIAVSACDSSSNDSATPTGPAAGTASDANSQPDPNALNIPTVSFEGDVSDEQVPYFGSQSNSGGVPDIAPGFVVAEADAVFCNSLATINAKPQPTDDFEQVVVGQKYFAAIAQTFPAELEDDLVVVVDWVDALIADGEFSEANEPAEGDLFVVALNTINEYVDTHCLGL